MQFINCGVWNARGNPLCLLPLLLCCPVQGSAADILKVAMVRIYSTLETDARFMGQARMVHTVRVGGRSYGEGRRGRERAGEPGQDGSSQAGAHGEGGRALKAGGREGEAKQGGQARRGFRPGWCTR